MCVRLVRGGERCASDLYGAGGGGPASRRRASAPSSESPCTAAHPRPAGSPHLRSQPRGRHREVRRNPPCLLARMARARLGTLEQGAVDEAPVQQPCDQHPQERDPGDGGGLHGRDRHRLLGVALHQLRRRPVPQAEPACAEVRAALLSCCRSTAQCHRCHQHIYLGLGRVRGAPNRLREGQKIAGPERVTCGPVASRQGPA
jgi:hypothetical protein